ncbi:MAG: hypothetical protein EAZ44_08870 [Cytophagia bacterium]|nr:MAG: hypothetical protein EAZ44_08870 [Cytophagia bacterium]TAG38593.1 MAG: hypothetical protein EAZ31_10315 [Cytophagia bacterium]
MKDLEHIMGLITNNTKYHILMNLMDSTTNNLYVKLKNNILLTLFFIFYTSCLNNQNKQDYLIFKSYEQDIYNVEKYTYFKSKVDTLYMSITNDKRTFIYYKNKEKTKIKEKFVFNFNKKQCLHIRFYNNIDTLVLRIIDNRAIENNLEDNYKKKNRLENIKTNNGTSRH